MGKHQLRKALNYTVTGANLHIRYSVEQLLYTLQSDLAAKQWGVTFVEVSVKKGLCVFGFYTIMKNSIFWPFISLFSFSGRRRW